jgi:hypothetical protein
MKRIIISPDNKKAIDFFNKLKEIEKKRKERMQKILDNAIEKYKKGLLKFE